MTIFSVSVTKNETATATIFVSSDTGGSNQLPEVIMNAIEAAQNGCGNFELNEGNFGEYYVADPSVEVESITLPSIQNFDDWQQVNDDDVVMWPEGLEQPLSKSYFNQLTYGGYSDWAYLLFKEVNDANLPIDVVISNQDNIENVLFTKPHYARFERLLDCCDAVIIDGGALLTDWERDDNASEDDDVLLTFRAVLDEFSEVHTEEFTIGAIKEGVFNGDKFELFNSNGDPSTIQTYSLTSTMKPLMEVKSTPKLG